MVLTSIICKGQYYFIPHLKIDDKIIPNCWPSVVRFFKTSYTLMQIYLFSVIILDNLHKMFRIFQFPFTNIGYKLTPPPLHNPQAHTPNT